MKKWFIALLFVFVCLPVAAVKAALPQTYIHLDYEVRDFVGEYYNIGDGRIDGAYGNSTWTCSNKIQIPKNVDKLYFSGWHTLFILFYNNETYLGFYYDDEFVTDLSFEIDAEEMVLGNYNYYGSPSKPIAVLDVPTNATHILLQTTRSEIMEDYLTPLPIEFNVYVKPLIYYPAPADPASNITFGLMPALMIVIVIAGLAGGLIMITKKSR